MSQTKSEYLSIWFWGALGWRSLFDAASFLAKMEKKSS